MKKKEYTYITNASKKNRRSEKIIGPLREDAVNTYKMLNPYDSAFPILSGINCIQFEKHNFGEILASIKNLSKLGEPFESTTFELMSLFSDDEIDLLLRSDVKIKPEFYSRLTPEGLGLTLKVMEDRLLELTKTQGTGNKKTSFSEHLQYTEARLSLSSMCDFALNHSTRVDNNVLSRYKHALAELSLKLYSISPALYQYPAQFFGSESINSVTVEDRLAIAKKDILSLCIFPDCAIKTALSSITGNQFLNLCKKIDASALKSISYYTDLSKIKLMPLALLNSSHPPTEGSIEEFLKIAKTLRSINYQIHREHDFKHIHEILKDTKSNEIKYPSTMIARYTDELNNQKGSELSNG